MDIVKTVVIDYNGQKKTKFIVCFENSGFARICMGEFVNERFNYDAIPHTVQVHNPAYKC